MPFLTRLLATQLKTLPGVPKCSLAGKVFIITGSNTGIGLEIAHQLASCGPALLILAVRNIKAGEEARQQILVRLSGKDKVDVQVWHVDMASFASVKEFVARCDALPRIDGVAMNAGVLGGTWQLTEDGHEVVSQVNVISPILLSILLAPKLQNTTNGDISATNPLPSPYLPRIIFTGSAAAEIAATKNFDPSAPLAGLDDQKRFVEGSVRYFESKLVLHSAISDLIKAFPGLVITDVGPGLISSPLYRDSPASSKFFTSLIGNSPEKGAKNITLAMLTLERSTEYFRNGQPSAGYLPYLQTTEGEQFENNLWRELKAVTEEVAPGSLAAAGLSF